MQSPARGRAARDEAGRSLLDQVKASVRRTARAHRPLHAVVAVFFVADLAVAAWLGFDISLGTSFGALQALGGFLLFFAAVFVAIELWFFFGSARGVGRRAGFLPWLRAFLVAGDRPGNAVHGLLAVGALTVGFDLLKPAIPLLRPFSWDERLAEWDRLLHGGLHPWQWLQPVFGHPLATAFLDFVYAFWFVVMTGLVLWQVFSRDTSRLRMQFLTANALAWFVGGNVLAVAFSSAGPCFYGRLGLSPDPYRPLMDYLRGVDAVDPLTAIRLQDLLWASYQGGHGLVSGISAAPSMHVTIATLMAVIGFRRDRRLGVALTLFAVLIGLGAVHLGWHYAIDAYLGVALAFLFWWAGGRLVDVFWRRAAASVPPA